MNFKIVEAWLQVSADWTNIYKLRDIGGLPLNAGSSLLVITCVVTIRAGEEGNNCFFLSSSGLPWIDIHRYIHLGPILMHATPLPGAPSILICNNTFFIHKSRAVKTNPSCMVHPLNDTPSKPTRRNV